MRVNSIIRTKKIFYYKFKMKFLIIKHKIKNNKMKFNKYKVKIIK